MSAPEVPHYRIVEKLGAGGMGEVFLAEDTRLKRRVALKFLPDDLVDHPDRRRRFLTEARAASSLSHPHVCVVYEVGETDDGRPFLAMEYLEGQSLDQMIGDSPLQNDQVVAIGTQIADALDAAHGKGIIHRDIKPANVSINERGQVKVLDFGLAKLVPVDCDLDEQSTQTMDGQILGTPNYMSPEQALGRSVDHRSDLFSLGVVLYELATSRRPFTGANFGEIVQNIVNVQPPALARFNYGIAPELERIILKCLQKAPQRRYQSARELLVDLNNLAFTRGASAAGSNPPSAVSGTIALPLPDAPSEISSVRRIVSKAWLRRSASSLCWRPWRSWERWSRGTRPVKTRDVQVPRKPGLCRRQARRKRQNSAPSKPVNKPLRHSRMQSDNESGHGAACTLRKSTWPGGY